MIQLNWQNREARNWRDRFNPSDFDGSSDRLVHECVSPDGALHMAECLVSVDGLFARLDYADQRTRPLNDQADIYPDVIELTFSDTDRLEVKAVHFIVKGARTSADVLISNDADAVVEGDPVLVRHMMRERDAGQRERKLADARARGDGELRCEVCRADSRSICPGAPTDRVYEVHHLQPLARGRQRVELADLAVLCANCHRAAHTLSPLPSSVDALRAALLAA